MIFDIKMKEFRVWTSRAKVYGPSDRSDYMCLKKYLDIGDTIVATYPDGSVIRYKAVDSRGSARCKFCDACNYQGASCALSGRMYDLQGPTICSLDPNKEPKCIFVDCEKLLEDL